VKAIDVKTGMTILLEDGKTKVKVGKVQISGVSIYWKDPGEPGEGGSVRLMHYLPDQEIEVVDDPT
jgi:DsbC/DsbD-like thiol-disulfide interchange protein